MEDTIMLMCFMFSEICTQHNVMFEYNFTWIILHINVGMCILNSLYVGKQIT